MQRGIPAGSPLAPLKLPWVGEGKNRVTKERTLQKDTEPGLLRHPDVTHARTGGKRCNSGPINAASSLSPMVALG